MKSARCVICLPILLTLLIFSEFTHGQEDDENSEENFIPCGAVINMESDFQYYFKTRKYGGANPDYTYFGGYRITDEFSRPSCLWTFVASDDCHLMVHFEDYYPGDRPCSIQYVSVGDHQTSIKACGYNSLPISFESTSNFVTVKHYRRSNVEYLTQFQGFAICHSGGTGYEGSPNTTSTNGNATAVYYSNTYSDLGQNPGNASSPSAPSTAPQTYTDQYAANVDNQPSNGVPSYEYSPPIVSGYAPVYPSQSNPSPTSEDGQGYPEYYSPPSSPSYYPVPYQPGQNPYPPSSPSPTPPPPSGPSGGSTIPPPSNPSGPSGGSTTPPPMLPPTTTAPPTTLPSIPNVPRAHMDPSEQSNPYSLPNQYIGQNFY